MSGAYARLTYDAILACLHHKEEMWLYDITYDCLRTYASGKWLCTYQDPYNYTPNLVTLLTAGSAKK